MRLPIGDIMLSIWTLASLAGHATATSTLTKLDPGPFNAEAYEQLLGCIRNVSSADKYHIGLDAGQIIIMPQPGEFIEDGDPVIRCLHLYSRRLHLSCAYDRWAVDVEGALWQPLSQATAEWAEANGAEGVYRSDLPAANCGRVAAKYMDECLAAQSSMVLEVS